MTTDAQPTQPVPAADRVRSGGRALAWVLVAIAAALNIAGFVLNWYDRPWFDEAIHAFSLFAFTLLAAIYLYGRALAGYPRHKLLLVLTILCVGLALGVVWEWGEAAYDHLSGPKSTIKGKYDTQMDLLMDAVGALVAGLLMLALVRRTEASA